MRRSEGGERTDQRAAWGEFDGFFQQYLQNGCLAFIEGWLKTDRYEDKGEAQYSSRVVAISMQMLEKRAEDENEPETEGEESGLY